MVKTEWGTKRTCPHCGARFYDLRHQPIICPKCSHVVEAEAPPRSRRPVASAPEPKPVPIVADIGIPEIEADEVEAVEEEDEIEGETIDAEEDEDAELIEDASDLGEDDDDMAEVMEHLDEDSDEV